MTGWPTLDGMVARFPALARAGLAGLLLCGVLGWMILDRASILRNGVEVRLATAPVDPRDLFRGDYVVLTYRVSFVGRELGPAGHAFRDNDPIFVELDIAPERPARVVAAHVRRPASLAPGRALLAGVVENTMACPPTEEPGAFRCGPDRPQVLRVRYGLESYFVPEGEGLAIERAERGRVEVVAAVTSEGRSAIKRLLLDGRPVHDEPPY
jgi:uncharacterized membrane-anchored protein